MIEPTINVYTLFSRLKELAETLTTQAAREALALDMRRTARLCEDDLDRQAMIDIAESLIENIPLTVNAL